MLELIPVLAILLATPRLSLWDIREHRLPNHITFPLIMLSTLIILLSFQTSRILAAFGLALLVFLIGWLLAHRNLVGMGDVKLLTAMALALGSHSPMSFLAALSIGLVVATVVSITRIAIKKITPNSSIALGPYLMLGFALIAIEPVGGFVVTVVA